MDKQRDLERKRAFIINTAYYAVAIGIVFVLFRYVMRWLMPFVIGFSIAFILKPLINKTAKAFHMKRKTAAALVVLLFYATGGVLAAVVLFHLGVWLGEFVYQIPDVYTQQIEPVLVESVAALDSFLAGLDPAFMASLQDVAASFFELLGSFVSGVSGVLLSVVSGTAMRVPVVLIFMLFSIISSFFFAMDYYVFTSFLVRQFSEKNRSLIFDIRDYLVGSVFQFVTSYMLIMFITFCELAIGLTVLGVKNSLGVAALTAMVDVLPVLGTGGVVLPWVLIELLAGRYSMALGLFALYIAITIIRNILEPKIVGTRVGLHPVLMLVSMYIGVRLLGPLGIVILPFTMIVVKNLNDNGKINLFK